MLPVSKATSREMRPFLLVCIDSSLRRGALQSVTLEDVGIENWPRSISGDPLTACPHVE